MIAKISIRYKNILITVFGLFFSFYSFSQESRFVGVEENLGNQVNSPFDELNISFSPDGSTMYFTRSRHPDNMGGRNDRGDIWVSTKDENGKWSLAKNAGEKFNNIYYNSVIGFSPDGNKMFLQNHYYEEGTRPKTQGISYVNREGSGWSDPIKVDIDNFYNSSAHQSMCISSDGKIMVMAINSFGSYGYEDLFVSFKSDDGTWTAPKNMGSTINTLLQEMTPYLSKDNTTLYFASSGHNSQGSRDIFVSKRLDHSWRVWSKPVNIAEINSEGIELSYVISPDEEYAYFISTKNSDGYGDINKIRLNPAFQPAASDNEQLAEFAEPDTVILISQSQISEALPPVSVPQEDSVETREMELTLEGVLLNIKTNAPIKGKISFMPTKAASSHPPIRPEVIEGKFSTTLKKEEYKAKVSAEGFMTEEIKFNLSDVSGSSLKREFLLTPLEAGTTFQLNNVLFDRGTANLVDSSYVELDRVIEMMKENPGIRIQIAGHTDNQGDARLNLKLSRERVETVLEYLEAGGISKDRLIGKGFGGTRPIASNKSEVTRKLNRRVEFTILGAD